MKVVVIGSGLIGLTSAWFLRQRGYEVTVIDREEGPGRETSFANGSLLTPSMAEPWNTPGCWRVLLGSIGRSDSPLQLRLHAVPAMMGWGMTFLRNSSAAKFEKSSIDNLRLSLHSLEVLGKLREQTGIEYGRTARGTLKIFRQNAALDHATAWAEHLSSKGLGFRRLSRQETVDLEPALVPIAEQLSGGIHYPADETGDAYRFCVALAEHARKNGVDFRFGTAVSSIELRSNEIAAVVGNDERFVADRYLVAAGSYTPLLLKQVGLDVPVQPAKGYSVTFDDQGRDSLSIPVVDDDLHAAVVPLQGAIRVAGTAEFAGYDRMLTPARIGNLVGLVQRVLPKAGFDAAAAKPWCGLRPMSVDGVPIISPTSIANLFVNTGHGHLGWTMAAGSGHLLADLMCGSSSAINPAPYALARFSQG